MRDILNGILALIGAESLTDAEFALVTIDETSTNLEQYQTLVTILASRESVSSVLDTLEQYYLELGVSVPAPDIDRSDVFIGANLDNATSSQSDNNVFIGASLDDSIAAGEGTPVIPDSNPPVYHPLLHTPSWFSDDGIPSVDLGVNTDFYLDNETGNIYKKEDDVWVFQINIKGTNGTNGQNGPNQVSTSTDTNITGLIKGTGTKIAQASAGTDYQAPIGFTPTNIDQSSPQTLVGDWLIPNVQCNSAPSDDLSASGLIAILTAGENLVFGDLVYTKSDGKMWKAKGNASSTIPCTAMALGNISANETGRFLKHGYVRNDAWNWAKGATSGIGYVSAATAGLLTQTAPSTTGNQVQQVGIAKSATVFYFMPQLTYLELL
jgi:hypothetical protein